MNIGEYREINSLNKIAVTKHARIRLEERGIHMDDIVVAIAKGEIIREYEDDKSLHLVISRDENFMYLITAYFPDSKQWEDDFKTRKECWWYAVYGMWCKRK